MELARLGQSWQNTSPWQQLHNSQKNSPINRFGPARPAGGTAPAFARDGRVPTVERFTFGAESKTRLIDCLTLGLSALALQYPAHRVLLAELRGFEYGEVGRSGRPGMGARPWAHDDTVIALALAWWAAPEADAVPLPARVLLGSQAGKGPREPMRGG